MRTTCNTHKWAYTSGSWFFSVLVQSLLSSYKFDGGSSRRHREGVGRTGGGDHLPRLSRSFPRAQDPPLPPLYYYCKECVRQLALRAGPNRHFPCPECRSGTVLPQNDPDQLRTAFFVNRMIATKRPRSTAHGVFCQPNERGARENGKNAGKSGSCL